MKTIIHQRWRRILIGIFLLMPAQKEDYIDRNQNLKAFRTLTFIKSTEN